MKTLEESIAYSLASAYARGVHEESGPFPGREDRIKEYAESSWREWLPAAKAAIAIGEPQEIKVVAPAYFEDDQECGYCHRPIGQPHKPGCRQ